MRIAILVEGRTETAFKPFLLAYLRSRLAGKMPRLDFVPQTGRIPNGDKLRRIVNNLLNDTKRPADAVIALTDVYTGSTPPEFPTADDAKRKMREWVGPEKRFHPHVALHDFEAWLLPYWQKIQRLTGSNRNSPGLFPEQVNHGKSPAYWLEDVFRTGSKTSNYIKTRDAGRILMDEDLAVAIEACPELKKFVETIAELSDPKKKSRKKG
jgi:Domain of unknown function (DUF4276)